MSSTPQTPAQAHELLAAQGMQWWRRWDVAALEAACAAVPDAALARWPDVARWRALAAFMQERADAQGCLELAHAGHLALGDTQAGAIDANMALVLGVIDAGTLRRVTHWLDHAGIDPEIDAPQAPGLVLWTHLGVLARTMLGDTPPPGVNDAAAWLHGQLLPMQSALAPDERIIAAQMLMGLHLLRGQFEMFDVLANTVEEPALFEAASAVMRGRWLHALGMVHYQIGNGARAEACWLRTMDLAREHGLTHMRLWAALSTLRLLLDRGRLAEAERLEAGIQPQWGAGRVYQLMNLKQMSARLQLMRGQAVQALAILREAFALAEQAGLGAAELASCQADLTQMLIANQRPHEALELLEKLASEYADRDAELARCLLELLQAWRCKAQDELASRALLAAGFRRAQQARYTMFFRLLPWLAADLCALALRWDIEPVFAAEVIRSRGLPAPADADERWPWWLYLRLFGGFEMRLRGEPEQPQAGRKVQKKPLELLRALACAAQMSWSMAAAADALWPEGDGDAASKSLETTVQRLRRLLGDDDNSLVLVSDGTVSLDPGRVSSDVAQRRVLIQRLEALALQPRSTAACAALAQRIAGLSAGVLLPGAPDAPWLNEERQRCQRDAARAARAISAVMARTEQSPTESAVLESALQELTLPRPPS